MSLSDFEISNLGPGTFGHWDPSGISTSVTASTSASTSASTTQSAKEIVEDTRNKQATRIITHQQKTSKALTRGHY